MTQQPTLLDALAELQKQLHAHYKMKVRKDFSLMAADAQASTAIFNARAAGQAGQATEGKLLDALVNLREQIHAHYKMKVRKDFSLMVADAQASTAIFNARAASPAEQSVTEPPMPAKVEMPEDAACVAL